MAFSGIKYQYLDKITTILFSSFIPNSRNFSGLWNFTKNGMLFDLWIHHECSIPRHKATKTPRSSQRKTLGVLESWCLGVKDT
jgi:hypothetical protein